MTGSRTTRWLGVAVLTGLALLVFLAFVATGPDERIDAGSGDVVGQFDAVRLIYVHVPIALTTYVAFTVTAGGSVMVLWKRSVWWDLVAHASAEIGTIAAALLLITGSVWGKPIWNTFWRWDDVRLMTSLVLFMLALGYLAVRRLEGTAESQARRAAIVGLLLIVNVVIVNRSVSWWADQTLHQESTLVDAKIAGLKLFTLMFGIVVGVAGYVWLMIHRFRVGWLERQDQRVGLSQAIVRRRAEAADMATVTASIDLNETRSEPDETKIGEADL